jgi:Predicted ATPase
MTTPIEGLSSLVIGTVESVSPREFKVILDADAPQTTAMNAGIPRGFPRINGYILIPNEQGAVVGLISWIGIERSLYPKRTGLKDFGLIDLPFPTRKLSIVPLGTLCRSNDNIESYELRRGISIFPSVGDKVCIPTIRQLRSIVESSGNNKRVVIGKAPLAENAAVSIDPDKIFGRHLAILGNTGSGKSCSVAGIIRWSLEEAMKDRKESMEMGILPVDSEEQATNNVNARFIILDPNGEYSNTFSDIGSRVFKVQPDIVSEQLKVPAWLWNSHEWGAFSRASSQVQRPILTQALKGIREGQSISDPLERRLIRVFKGRYLQLGSTIGQGAPGYSGFPANLNCGIMIENIQKESEHYFQLVNVAGCSNQLEVELNSLKEKCSEVIKNHKRNNYFNDFSEPALLSIHQQILKLLGVVQTEATVPVSGVDADSPVSFNIEDFPEYLETLAAEAGGGAATNIQYLIMRIRTMLSDRRFNQVVAPITDPTFEEWLESYIGKDQAQNGPVAVIDLSLVPSDLLHVIAAVISRIVFEAVQRYKKLNEGKELPTVLVLEEAHTFIKRDIADDQSSAASIECRRIFERIAREGRKFGLGLVLSSQRPSELSPTVLSQCNTFLLHRIVNDRDQELVSKLVPDNLGGLLSELPSLPAGEAILMGWASPIPVLVKMKELPVENRPESSDPDYWNVWVGTEERRVNWNSITTDWMQ